MNANREFMAELTAAVDGAGLITGAADMAPYLKEERGLLESTADAVVRPADAETAAAVIALCAKHGVPVVPLGGNTGLVGGGVAAGGIILSTERLNKILETDPLNLTMTVEAGVILADIQAAASDAGCLFPLSLGAEGSCRIGGNLSTNAGGVGVLRYGNTRDLVLGIEVVLPNGEIWNGLNALRKDNTGYDLKQLFIGAEGTLGLITKAVLKLYPAPKSSVTIFAALSGIEAALALFDRVRAVSGDRLTAFEMLPRFALEIVTEHIPDTRDPFDAPHSHYALIELTSAREGDNLRDEIEHVLSGAFEAHGLEDAVFAESEAQAGALWKLREEIPAAQSREGASIKHDVAVPVSRTAEFIARATAAVEAEMPGVRVCAFGHMGDGNTHFNLTQPEDMVGRDFLARWTDFNRIVHDIVTSMRGSISAEHGIGLIKRDELAHYHSEVEIELMKTIKRAIDPQGIMNPGKLVSP